MTGNGYNIHSVSSLQPIFLDVGPKWDEDWALHQQKSTLGMFTWVILWCLTQDPKFSDLPLLVLFFDNHMPCRTTCYVASTTH